MVLQSDVPGEVRLEYSMVKKWGVKKQKQMMMRTKMKVRKNMAW
eukprot:CAMPEP_0118641830 /NCGR_PEP_ID=MMETSP0785-20121206/5511_1 /TAXON_ID=91992 /ORGANISM="Bolidomonas pacifica, Strain CCMP 1866" /LENGTH=43 /DNA_ID= /DNA_START= /DNA_END= /DNA_ORIENTATION=